MPSLRASKTQALKRALTLTLEALDLLDLHDASPQAAAHLALAQQELERALQNSR